MSELSTTSHSPVAAIILAAGKSTRMKSSVPKPLHTICGDTMASHVIRACRLAGVQRIVMIVGHQSDTVINALSGEGVEFAVQTEQKGTANAVQAAEDLLGDWPGDIITLAADTPLLTAESVSALIQLRNTTTAPMAMLTARLDNPTGYGRVIRNENGTVNRIVEETDASPAEKLCNECNPSLYAFLGNYLWPALRLIGNSNAKGEYYLTDLVEIFSRQNKPVVAQPVADVNEVLGVNSQQDLATAAAVMRRRLLNRLMAAGTVIVDPASTYIDFDVEVGQDTTIEPFCVLLRGTRIGRGCVIGPYTRIEQSKLGNDVRALASWISYSTLEDGAKIGPYSQLRPGSHLASGVRIGNFVEVKNSTLGPSSQASHLSYIGDAIIGSGVNIGAGTITCNYDGYFKHQTVVGDNAFIGSHSTLIAPVTVGSGAFVAAGSPITGDIPEDSMVIARQRAIVKEDWARAYRIKKRSEKEQKSAKR